MNIDEYRKFICNPENSMNCKECPENSGQSDWLGTRKPCGQFRCWIDVTCDEEEEQE